MKDGGFAAAFLAVGAHIAKRAFIPAKDSARILDAVAGASLDGRRSKPPMLGRRVVVYGGGNTAIDVARTAKRLGATEAVIVYRRTREKMPAHDFEVEEALEEGVLVKWLSTIKQAGRRCADDREDEARREGQPAADRRARDARRPIRSCSRSARTSTSRCSTGVPGLKMRDGVVEVDPATMMTGHPGLFAGGDMVPAERNVTVADRPRQEGGAPHRRLAARRAARAAPKHAPATFERLNTWYYTDAPKTVRPQLDLARRTSSFDEVQGGLTEDNALFEARRCLSCGNCFECDNCYGVCPDNAVVKLGPGNRFAFNYDYCKGCGVCVAECPCGAIEMVPEDV